MLWSNERIESSAKVAWREGTYCSIDILMRMMRDEYESRIAELEADHAAALDKWMDAIADLQASLRKTRERIIELEAQLAAIAATDNGTLPEDPRKKFVRECEVLVQP